MPHRSADFVHGVSRMHFALLAHPGKKKVFVGKWLSHVKQVGRPRAGAFHGVDVYHGGGEIFVLAMTLIDVC